jgi:hypothetical protein
LPPPLRRRLVKFDAGELEREDFVNKFEQLQEVSVSEMASVDGGGIWFPIIFGIVRFGLANANHNGSSSSGGMTNRELIESLGTKWPK